MRLCSSFSIQAFEISIKVSKLSGLWLNFLIDNVVCRNSQSRDLDSRFTWAPAECHFVRPVTPPHLMMIIVVTTMIRMTTMTRMMTMMIIIMMVTPTMMMMMGQQCGLLPTCDLWDLQTSFPPHPHSSQQYLPTIPMIFFVDKGGFLYFLLISTLTKNKKASIFKQF